MLGKIKNGRMSKLNLFRQQKRELIGD